MKLKYLTYRPFLHTCLLFFIFIGGSSCNYLPGSTTLCRIHLSGKEATYDLHLKRPYNDISMVFPIEAYKQIGDVMVQATVTNTGKTKPRIFYHERMPKNLSSSAPVQKIGSYRTLAPGDTIPVYNGPIKKFGISFTGSTIPGSNLSVHLLFEKALTDDYNGELLATWGAP